MIANVLPTRLNKIAGVYELAKFAAHVNLIDFKRRELRLSLEVAEFQGERSG